MSNFGVGVLEWQKNVFVCQFSNGFVLRDRLCFVKQQKAEESSNRVSMPIFGITGSVAGATGGFLLLVIGLGFSLLVLQAYFGPLDGFVSVKNEILGGSIAVGPFLAKNLLPVLHPILSKDSVRLGYVGLFVMLPIFSSLLIYRFLIKSMAFKSRIFSGLFISVLILIGLSNVLNLPYLSNDIYLYQAHGQMISQFGENPYLSTPLESIDRGHLKNVPWVNQKSPYGPAALLGFGAICSISSSDVVDFWLLKIVLSLPWLILLGFMFFTQIFKREQKFFWLAWVGLNPLLVFEICQNGHLEGWLGLLLFFLCRLFLKVTQATVVVGGILFGLACAIKLSVVVTGPVFLFFIVSHASNRRLCSWGTARLVASFVGPAFLTLTILYMPLWQGFQTLVGVQEEAGKTLRSLYWVCAYYLDMTPGSILVSSLIGNICAGVFGVFIYRIRGSLTMGILGSLLLQIIFGRTFLQPWYFCTLVMIAPMLGLVVADVNNKRTTSIKLSAGDHSVVRFLLNLSICALVGGYAIPVFAGGHSSLAQAWSVIVMIVIPIITHFGFSRLVRTRHN